MIERKTLNMEINRRNEAIAFEREQETVVLANLGQAVFDAGMASEGKLSKNAEQINEISDEIGNLEGALRALLKDDERRHVIQDEKKHLNVEIRNNRNKKAGFLEDLGRGAWALLKSGRHIHKNLETALEDVIEAERRLHDAEDALSINTRERGDRMSSILARGKTFLLNGRKKSAAAALDRQWEKAGMKVAELIPLEAFAETPVSSTTATLQSLDNLCNEAEKRIDELKKELDQMDADLEELPGSGGLRKRMTWIERVLDERRNNLDEAYRTLGRIWGESHPSKTRQSDVEERRLEWTALGVRIQKFENEKSAFTDHLEFLEIQDLAEKKNSRIARLDEEIKSRQASMKELKKELNSLEKDLAERKERLPRLPEYDSLKE